MQVLLARLGHLPLTVYNYLDTFKGGLSLDERVHWLTLLYKVLPMTPLEGQFKDVIKSVVKIVVPELWFYESATLIKKLGRKNKAEVVFDVVTARDSLTKDELGRLRFRQTNMPPVQASSPALTLEWQLYRYTLQQFHPRALRYLERTYDIDSIMISDSTVPLLLRISDREKKKGGEFSKLCIDLATLGGYQIPDDSKNMEVAMNWFGTAKKKGYPGWEAWFDVAIDKVLGDYFINSFTDTNYLTIDQYANAPVLWGTAGSVLYYKNVHIHGKDDGKTYSARNTKWAAGIDIDPKDVVSSMTHRRAQYCKMVHKAETKKVREVVSSDLETHWKMDYISQMFLDPLSHGSKLSTLSMSSEDTVDMWTSSAKFTGSVRCPLDQSAFDQEQTRDMIVLLVTKIRDLILVKISASSVDPVPVRKIFDDTIYGMSHGYVLVDGIKIPYRNGVLSGWRWTAMVDSLLNAATFYVPLLANDMLPSLISVVSQGDDIKSDFNNWITPVVVWHDIQRAGFLVNPGKFFIADDRDEFLRKIIMPNIVDAYPARAVNSIFFRNPVNMPPAPGAVRVGEMLSQWNLFLGRLGVSIGMLKDTTYWGMVLQDIASANEVYPTDVDNWMHTPISLGGGGFVPFNHHSRWRSFESSVALEHPQADATPSIVAMFNTSYYISDLVTLRDVVTSMSKRVSWKGLTYSRSWIVGMKDRLVALDFINASPVDLTRSGPVPRFSKPLSKLQMMVFSMSEEAAASLFISKHGTSKFSRSMKSDLVLNRLSLPVPRVFGVSNMYNGSYIKQYLLGPAINHLVSMRRPSSTSWLQYQLRFELSFSDYKNNPLALVGYNSQNVLLVD